MPMLLPSLLAALVALLPSPARTADSEWSAFTSMSRVNDLLVSGRDVWAATSGGALHYDRSARVYQRLTRLDGLAGNRLLSVTADSSGDLWFGTDGLGLSRYHPATATFDPPFLEFRDLRIGALLSAGDRLYVGTSRGVSVFLIAKQEVKESYRSLGLLPKDVEVTALASHGGILFAGTEEGVAWAPLAAANLQDPDSWRSLHITGAVLDLAVAGGLVLAATRLGVFTYDPAADRFFEDFVDAPVTSLGELDGSGVAATEDGDFMRRRDRGLWSRIPAPIITGVNALSRNGKGSLWLGTAGGLRVVGSESPPPPAREPGSSRFYDMALSSGQLWVASVPDDQQRTLSAGVYERTAEGWTVYDRSTGMPNNELVAVSTDRRGRLWVGSWGGGVVVREPGGTWTAVDRQQTVLRGVSENDRFVVISDIQRDAGGNMWLVNVLAGIAVLDDYPPREQFLFDQDDLGLPAKADLFHLAIDAGGLKWIASRDHGLVLLDDGGTPFLGGDDRALLVNQAFESRLSSNRAFDVLAARDGTVWLATDRGLNAVRATYDRGRGQLDVEGWRVYTTLDGLPSTEVNALAQDDAGNIWVATEGGLSHIGSDGEIDFTLTQRNSGLIDNRVKSLLFDAQRGELWIGTFDGLNRLHVVASSDGGEPSGLAVYPNPFAASGRRPLTFAGLPLGAALRIFTAAGELVSTLQADPGRGAVTWAGLNGGGFLVASGIYYFVAEGEAGDRVQGRFAVVNGAAP